MTQTVTGQFLGSKIALSIQPPKPDGTTALRAAPARFLTLRSVRHVRRAGSRDDVVRAGGVPGPPGRAR